jgi:cytoskeletal protein CcmA (bactofilin family)
MQILAPLELITVTATLLALPVMPAINELRTRRDAAPLPTSRHDAKIANFAEAFASRVESLAPEFENRPKHHEPARISVEGMEALVVGADGFDFPPVLLQGITTIICASAVLIPPGWVVDADVYARSSLELGNDAALRAAFGNGNITLGENSAVLRWLDAEGSIYLRQGSTSFGRLSSRQSITLERGCAFQHLHAPQILTTLTGREDSASSTLLPDIVELNVGQIKINEEADSDSPQGADVAKSSRPRLRIKGDFVLPAGETLNANVIATGSVRLEPGTRLFGSAKSYKDVVVEENACIHGSVICGKTARLGSRAFVVGPVMAEGDVMIARGSRVGTPGALTTVSACGIQLEPGCQLHGTVRARIRGSVED